MSYGLITSFAFQVNDLEEHIRDAERGHNASMTLKLGRGVRVNCMRTCIIFHVSVNTVFEKKTFRVVSPFVTLDFS